MSNFLVTNLLQNRFYVVVKSILLLVFIGLARLCSGQQVNRVLVLYENGGHHRAFTDAARPWLIQLGKDSALKFDFYTSTQQIDSGLLSRYDLFLQLDYPPYGWAPTATAAFEQAITKGTIGWIGLHHASLLGEFDSFPIWPWFWKFMGEIRFKNYIADFASGKVEVEEPQHPVMDGLPKIFQIEKEEWYTYDQSPRNQVKVLASVNESTYSPNSDIKMGDHPVVWTNTLCKARNLYIFMGHSPDLFANPQYCRLLQNALRWAAGKK